MAEQTFPSRQGGALMRAIKARVNAIPLLGPVARRLYFGFLDLGFEGSQNYWERRYRAGLDSGAGSYGCLASFKAEVLNRFVRENGVESVIEFGCGDGAQLSLAQYPRYHGVDVSPTAIERCRARFQGDVAKTFALAAATITARYDLSLSLDVIYHLTEDEIFDSYMRGLFMASRRFVIVYSSNKISPVPEPHLRHRRFTDWVETHAPDWRLREVIPNRYPFDPRDPETSFADFYIFERRAI